TARLGFGEGALSCFAQWRTGLFDLRFIAHRIAPHWFAHAACMEPLVSQHNCSGTRTQGLTMFNASRTTLLLAALTALFMVVGYFIGGTSGMMLAFGFALLTNLFSYWNSDKLVLRMQNAVPVERSRVPELYEM